MSAKITASQTIGPFPHEAWRWAVDATATVQNAGPLVSIHGSIRDGDGNPINDAQIEAWIPHAEEAEKANPLPGFRRIPSDDEGGFKISIPRSALGNSGEPAAYITVFARGLVVHQFTAVFLEDDAGLGESKILSQVPSERRGSLIAAKQGELEYKWDIWMQSENETVFFDYM